MDDEQLVAVGLLNPAVDDPSRAALIRRCLELGLTAEEIRDAGGDLIDRAVQHVHYADTERLTIDEVAARSSVPAQRVEMIIRAGGRHIESDEAALDTHDVAMMSTIDAAMDILGEDAMLQIARAAEAAVGRIGDAVISAFLTGVAAPSMRDDDSGLQLLEANILGANLLPRFGDVITQMLRQYMRRSYRPSSDVSLASALGGVDTRLLAVGFADLVGSTELGASAPLTELNAALDLFERTAADIIAAGGGRVVKFIGDEVMFRADSADAASALAIALVEAVRADTRLPPLRAGVAYGMVASREGDFHGPVVNLAARLTKLAPADGLLVSRRLVESLAVPDDFTVRDLGDIEVRGFSETIGIAEMSSRPQQ